MKAQWKGNEDLKTHMEHLNADAIEATATNNLAARLAADEQRLWKEYQFISELAREANNRWSDACTRLRELAAEREP